MTIIDVTYTTNIGERHGRRRMFNNHTGEMWWEPNPDAAPEPEIEEEPEPIVRTVRRKKTKNG